MIASGPSASDISRAPTADLREGVRRDLVSLIAARRSVGEVREAIAFLDSTYAPLTPDEDLTVARAAGSSGPPARAVAGYSQAFEAGLGTSEDRYAYAAALGKLGRYAESASQFDLVRTPKKLAASAAYQRARALVRDGQLSEGRAALFEVLRRYRTDTVAGSSALFLLGDLAADDGADDRARTYNRRLAIRYPTSTFAPTARFRAAMLALLAGEPDAGRERVRRSVAAVSQER